MQALREHRLVVVRAPAGCGKTSALADGVLRFAEDARAWVNVEPGETLPSLLQALVEALDPADLPWRLATGHLVAQAADGADPAASAASVAEALRACGRAAGVIALDDFHHCADPAAARWLGALVDGLPAGWALALGTREEPHAWLGLARRRVRAEVAEFGRDDLAFSAAEVQALAQLAGWRHMATVQTLAQLTQGWPAAVRLALAARGPGLQAVTSLATDERLFAFVAAEVVDQLPAVLRRFLLRCSVLPELTASRAAAVSADADAAMHLAQLRRRELFVSRVDAHGTLRLHDLFRQALLHQLERDEPGLLPTLLARAAAGERDPLQRVRWLLQAGERERAAAELEAASAALITQGQGRAVEALLQCFDDVAQQAWPALALVQARLAWADWDFGRMLRVLDQVPPEQLASAGSDTLDLLQAYRVVALDSLHRSGECAELMQALDARTLAPLPRLVLRVTQLGLPRGADDLVRTALRLRETAQLADRIGTADAWYQALPASNLFLLPGTAMTLGQMAEAMRTLCAGEPTPLRAWAGVLQAWAELGRGDTPAAFDATAEAEDDARWHAGMPPVMQEIHFLRALLHAVWGQPEQAWRAVERSLSVLPPQALPGLARLHRQQIEFERRARVAALLGDVDVLRRLLESWPDGADPTQAPGLAKGAARAALAAAQSAWPQAREAWQVLIPDLHHLAGRGQAIELRLRLASACLHEQGVDAAAAALAPALQAPQALHEPGPAVLAGAGLMAGLAEVDWQHRLTQPDQVCLHAWSAAAQREARRAPAAAEPGAPGLSEREREVLERIARGDANKDIARRFGISGHTVKRHVANILDKLELRSRGQAAAWFHAQAR